MTAIVPFDFNDNPLRTVTVDEATWFNVPDACSILDVANPSDVLKRIDPRDIRRSDALASNDPTLTCESDPFVIRDSLGRWQAPNWVNESGLYDLIFESRKPQARAFRRWVTSEVLPQIRRTGQYVPAPVAEPLALPPAEPQTEQIGDSLIMVTREPDETWTDLTDIYFFFDFRDSAEAAAWLPAGERRKFPGRQLAPGLPLWQVSQAGLARLLRERKPAASQPYGAILAHEALTAWTVAGLPALPPPSRLELT